MAKVLMGSAVLGAALIGAREVAIYAVSWVFAHGMLEVLSFLPAPV